MDKNQKQEFDSYLNSIIHEVLEDIKKENPEKYEKLSKERNELVKELFEQNAEDKYWFDMIK